MELEVCCPICKTVQRQRVDGRGCELRCQVPECRALFEYVGHCHLFLDIYRQAERLHQDGYHTPAYILAFVSLELYLEWFMARKMLHDGREHREVRRFLRQHQHVSARMGGPFQRVFGHSLDEVLARWGGLRRGAAERVQAFRETRNQVVHEGYQVSAEECREALDLTRTLYDALTRMAAREGWLSVASGGEGGERPPRERRHGKKRYRERRGWRWREREGPGV